ncbi:PTS sugar transporter subunit IIA [Pantoea sp. BAV 3049]|uniref:PTS sugar transporter subunit IIA n=1 Tax=Pantoea sp. BAV 3049 TaxID=2654188 RepID=UPI00131E2743|nr:PTS sugar transporter subunit IIA [Pantoea sp. BAV 3049]
MDIIKNLDPTYIWLNQQISDRETLFAALYDRLRNEGIVEETYLAALSARENEHPTAMQLEQIGVAIPHVDVEHIIQEKLVVVTCPQGMTFKSAEDPDEPLTVHAIFFLLLQGKDEHLTFLMKLIELFRQTDRMNDILTEDKPENVVTLLQQQIK